MQKFMCNVCGKLHGIFNDAALCHPDVVIKEFPDLPDRDAEQRDEAVAPKQSGACKHPRKYRLPSGRLFCPQCDDYI
jgi:hypothetical protein